MELSAQFSIMLLLGLARIRYVERGAHMVHRVWSRLFTVGLLASLVLAGCGAAAPTATPELPPASASIQLSWFHSIEFAGVYEALNQGYASQNKLDLTIKEGGITADGAYIDPVTEVQSGNAEFGIAGADVLLRARAAGSPLVAIAAIYQRSPVALVSLKDSNVLKPADLAGKTIGIAPPDTTVYISYRALLESEQVDPATITEVPVLPQSSVDDLFSGKIDVLHAFITHEATQARARDASVNVLLLSDYGIDIYSIDIYSNVIFTTESMIAEHPETVQAFINALTKGLTWAVDHPEDAAKHVVETYGATMAPPIQALQDEGMLASVPLIRPAGSQPGMMNAKIWDNTEQVLLSQKLIDKPLDVAKAYTLTFLNSVYGQ